MSCSPISSSVASFLVLEGGGGKTPKCTDKKKNHVHVYNFYARASASETYIYIQVSKYICIHKNYTINAVPFISHGMALYILTKHYITLWKIYGYASERSERA